MDKPAPITTFAPPIQQRYRIIRRFTVPLLVLLALFIGYRICAFVYLVNPPDRRSWSHGNVEQSPITSPDSKFDAVVSCYCDTPAMVSPYFYLHIFPKGRKVGEYSSGALLVTRRDMKLEWIDNAHLKVNPAQGTIEYFTNLWAPNDEKLPFVEIILAQDPSNGLITPEGSFR